MSIAEEEEGRNWIAKNLKRLGRGKGVRVETFTWKHLAGSENQRLKFSLNDANYELEFLREDIEDCPTSPNVRSKLGEYLREEIKKRRRRSEGSKKVGT